NPNQIHVATDWAIDSRARRLHEVLGKKSDWTVTENFALQRDVVSLSALEVVQGVGEVTFTDPSAERLRQALSGWNGEFSRESLQATVFVEWSRIARKRLIALELRHVRRLLPQCGSFCMGAQTTLLIPLQRENSCSRRSPARPPS